VPEGVKAILMSECQLFLISANKSRLSGQPSPDDDYDVRYGSKQGPVIGRIYKKTFSPSDRLWFWTVNCFVPAQAADTGDAATREDAIAELKARWIERNVMHAHRKPALSGLYSFTAGRGRPLDRNHPWNAERDDEGRLWFRSRRSG
jgi:hypothetical protein